MFAIAEMGIQLTLQRRLQEPLGQLLQQPALTQQCHTLDITGLLGQRPPLSPHPTPIQPPGQQVLAGHYSFHSRLSSMYCPLSAYIDSFTVPLTDRLAVYPQRVDNSLIERPACQWMKISVTSTTSNFSSPSVPPPVTRSREDPG